MFKATDVEDLLKVADYGEEPIENSSEVPPIGEQTPPFVGLAKSSNVLGINREAIMNQVTLLYLLLVFKFHTKL